jgi:hypothetical protein
MLERRGRAKIPGKSMTYAHLCWNDHSSIQNDHSSKPKIGAAK